MDWSWILIKVDVNKVVLDAGVEGIKSDRDLNILWDDLADGTTTSIFWNYFTFLALDIVFMKDYKTKKRRIINFLFFIFSWDEYLLDQIHHHNLNYELVNTGGIYPTGKYYL